MKRLWRLLNSRKFAVYLLLCVLVILVFSGFLPNTYTVSAEHWEELRREKPFVFWLSSRLSTPYVVKNPAFIAISAFLFLSTVSCTATRLRRWLRTRRVEFEKEHAFSFSIERLIPRDGEAVKEAFLRMLGRKRWATEVTAGGGEMVVAAQKGSDVGFWGSVVFHLGLIISFLAAPATALTLFRGELVVPEGVTVPLRAGMVSHTGRELGALPDVDVTVLNLEGVYEKGIYEVHFGGRMRIGDREFPFSVNNPVEYEGYQLSLHEFGFSPLLVVRKGDATVFDYILNLTHAAKGDYFDLPAEGLRLFVILFPDFIRDGDLLGSRTREPRNPMALVRFLRGSEEVAGGLVRLGETEKMGEYSVEFADLRNWGNFVVVREGGVPVIWAGMLLGLPGLLVRFLSNERRLELRVSGAGTPARVVLKGYSRYYPAFLEEEVKKMAGRLAEADRA